MNAEKLSSDEVPHKFAEWLLGMGCPAEKVPSIEKMSQMCRGQYYMVWRSLMEHVKPKDLIGRKRLQVFLNDVQMCQEKNVFNECNAGSIVVPEELKLWKQQNDLKEMVAEVESRIALTMKTQQELNDKITCKIGQRNLIHQQIKDLQRRTWMLQQVSSDLATKKANLNETKCISDSLCNFENTSDLQSKVERCISVSRPVQQLPIPNPMASSSVASPDTDNNERDENMMSLVKCRGDALWPLLYETRARLVEQVALENTKHQQHIDTRTTPQSLVVHTAALQSSISILALKNRLQLAHTREKLANAINHLNKYISGESCELLVLRCEKVKSEARVRTLKTLLNELGENSGVFSTENGSDHSEATPGKIAAMDKCIANTKEELKRLILSLYTTDHKINNIKDCLFHVFTSFHNDTAINEERFRGVQIDFPRESICVLKKFYADKSLRSKKENISLELEVSDYSYNESVDKNPTFIDELRFYLDRFNLEKNRELVLDSGEKIWIFETLKSLSSNLYKKLAVNDVTMLCPSVTLSCSIRQLIEEVQKINVLESIIKQLNVTDMAGLSIDIDSKTNKEEMVLDKIKKCLSENSNLLTKINKTLDISRRDLEFWSESNFKKYISKNKTIDGKCYKEYEHLYLENIMLNV